MRISEWGSPSWARRPPLVSERLAPYLFAVLLCGCSTLRPVERSTEPTDWIEFSNQVRALDPRELELRYLAAARQHAEMPTNETAIRLAVLLADSRAYFYDNDRALELLDDVARDAEDGTSDAEFARFLRDLLGPLAAERAQRQALESQLDALKALEQRLNADELER